jgi:hypothetical protein
MAVEDGSPFNVSYILQRCIGRREGSDRSQEEGRGCARILKDPRPGVVDILEVRKSRIVLFFLFCSRPENSVAGLCLILGEPLIGIT